MLFNNINMIEISEINFEEHSNENTKEPESNEVALEKNLQTQKEKEEILNRIASRQIENIRDRVAIILNYSIEARNSDIDLAWIYWETFESDKMSGSHITREQMKVVARIPSLTRIRAKIQNEYKLFQADNNVKRYRGMLEKSKKSDAIEDKPTGIGLYSVYIDETGKTQDFLSVGSLWILKYQVPLVMSFQNWMIEQNYNFEFHFAELTKGKLESYKKFFIKFISMFPESGFKLIVVKNKGFTDKNHAISDLTYHLIIKGVEHENVSGRAPLPRRIDVCIDQKETGSDQLKVANIEERLASKRIKNLYIGEFITKSSSQDFFLQIVDLFTGSINRKLHSQDSRNFKDDFADFVLNTLNFDLSKIDKSNTSIDNSMVFDLAYISSDNSISNS